MKTRACIILVLIVSRYCTAQTDPSILWQSSLGGSRSEDIAGHVALADGGLVVLGSTSSIDGDLDGMPYVERRREYYNYDIWLVKLDNKQNVVWQQVIGGSNRDSGTYIIQTSDGGFLLSATTNSNDGDFAGTPGTGQTVIIKTTSGGSIEWTHKFDLFRAYSLKEFSDGTYRFCGISLSHGRAVIGKINRLGEAEWIKEYESESAKFHTACFDIIESEDGFFLSGFLDDQYQWFARFLDQGQVLWEQLLGDIFLEWHLPMGISAIGTRNGGFATIGTYYDGDGLPNIHFKRLRSDGSRLLLKELHPPGRIAYGIGLVEVDSEEFVLCGVTDIISGIRDIVMLGVRGDGKIHWMRTVSGNGLEYPSRSITYANGNFTFSGMTESTGGDLIAEHGGSDIWLMTLGQTASVSTQDPISLSLFPMPADTYLKLRTAPAGEMNVSISDITGKILRTMHRVPSGEVSLYVGDLTPGTYFVTIQSNDREPAQEKFIKR